MAVTYVDDLEADVPWLVKTMMQNGTLWQPYQPVDRLWVRTKLWERDEPERAKIFPSKDPNLPQRLLAWREPYGDALLTAAVLGEWVEMCDAPFVERHREMWRVTQKGKTDFSPLAGLLVSDENIRKNLIMGVDYAALEHRVLAQLAEEAPLADFGFDVSALIRPEKQEATVTVIVRKNRGPAQKPFVIATYDDMVDALACAHEEKPDGGA